MIRHKALSLFGFVAISFLLAPVAVGLQIGDRVKAAAAGANVRDANLVPRFTQVGGVHGTITAAPIYGTAGGFTGNWWPIRWDAQPPSEGSTQGWSAESVISLAPLDGDVPQPDFGSSYYTTGNIFYPNNAPPFPEGALGNCTWYAHGRLLQLGYNASQLQKLSGNASQWDNQAIANGIKVDNTPTVHSIAQTDTGAGGLGHVAVVESLNSDGTITVTESGYATSSTSAWNFLWRHRTVDSSWFQRFIHVSRDVDEDIAALANTTQTVKWFYIATNNQTKWYIVSNDSAASVLLLHSVDPNFAGGIRWKPINNYQSFAGFPAKGLSYSSVTTSSNGHQVSFGYLNSFSETDSDVTSLTFSTETVYWFYINAGSRWYIVASDTASNPAVMYLSTVDPSIPGGIRWKPINNFPAFGGFQGAGTNFTSVTVSSDGRMITFGALK